jgi:hypothetical protein
MSTHHTNVLRCDHPDCAAVVEVKASGRPIPENWWFNDRTTIRGMHACPEHAPEATAAELRLHQWDKRRIKAMNAWTKKNPHPKVAEWLEDLIP